MRCSRCSGKLAGVHIGVTTLLTFPRLGSGKKNIARETNEDSYESNICRSLGHGDRLRR
jgi:hypothetical protein